MSSENMPRLRDVMDLGATGISADQRDDISNHLDTLSLAEAITFMNTPLRPEDDTPDVYPTSEPKPGCAADLKKTFRQDDFATVVYGSDETLDAYMRHLKEVVATEEAAIADVRGRVPQQQGLIGAMRAIVQEVDSGVLGRERPEYEQRGAVSADVVLAEGANLIHPYSGLAARQATGEVDGVIQPYIVFNPEVGETERAGLGFVGMSDGKLYGIAPDRHSQVWAVHADPNRHVRRPRRSVAQREAGVITAGAFGMTAELATYGYGIVHQEPLTRSIEAVGVHGDMAQRLAELAPVVGAMLVGAVTAVTTFKMAMEPRLSRGVGRYGINDLKRRTELAGDEVDVEKIEQVGSSLRIPNRPVHISLSRQEAVQAGIVDEAGKPVDIDFVRHGLKVTTPENSEEAVTFEAAYGDLFLGLISEENWQDAKATWEQRYSGQAFIARDLLKLHAEAATAYDEEQAVQQQNGGYNQERTNAAAEALREANLLLVTHTVQVMQAREAARYDAQLAKLSQPHLEGNKPFTSVGLRNVVMEVVSEQLQRGTQTAVNELTRLNERLLHTLAVVTDKAHLEAVYKALRDDYRGKLDLPDWHMVGPRIEL